MLSGAEAEDCQARAGEGIQLDCSSSKSIEAISIASETIQAKDGNSNEFNNL